MYPANIVSKRRIGRGQSWVIAFVWLLLFAIPLLFGEHPNGINWEHIRKIWTEYMLVFIIFLFNRLVLLPHLFFKGKRLWYFVSILAIITIFITLIFMHSKRNIMESPNHLKLLPPERIEQGPVFPPPRPGPRQREFIPAYGNLLILTILLIGFDSGLIFFSKWMQSEQNKLKAEKESIKNKMDFLQTQISPHFLMNTLNNIHALVDIDPAETKESIIRLSEMMDYMLYKSQAPGVELQQEMDFIRSYVDLMRLRYTSDVDLVLDIPPVLPPVKITPLLTISFIENAFKYGISYEAPSYIHMRVYASETQFSFNIRNSLHPGEKDREGSGIGIENARNRLELIYGDNYDLSIKSEKNNFFEVDLTIPL